MRHRFTLKDGNFEPVSAVLNPCNGGLQVSGFRLRAWDFGSRDERQFGTEPALGPA
jgi:hypothetical protein